MKISYSLFFFLAFFFLIEKTYANNDNSNKKLMNIVLENVHNLQKDIYGNRIILKASSLICFSASEIPYGTCHMKGEYPDAGGPNGAQFAIIVGMNDEGSYWFKTLDIISWD